MEDSHCVAVELVNWVLAAVAVVAAALTLMTVLVAVAVVAAEAALAAACERRGLASQWCPPRASQVCSRLRLDPYAPSGFETVALP